MAGSTALLKTVFQNRFRTGLLVVLCVVLAALLIRGPQQQAAETAVPASDGVTVHVFYSPGCPHCRKELAFLEEIKPEYPGLHLVTHNINLNDELELMVRFMQDHGLPTDQIATPLLFIGDRHLLGFHEADTTGALIEYWIQQALYGADNPGTASEPAPEKDKLDLPVIGEIDPFKLSLPALAVVLGVIDGFNPCAMWVLVYLISLIIGMKDRSRIYILIGTFLLASGVLYFLFMTAWLNVFLVLGYIHALTVIIGLAAIYFGALSLEDFVRSGGQLVCAVGDMDTRQKTRLRIRHLVASPLGLMSFAGIVGLAFAVNSIEFICSSAMPALFTHVLSVADVSTPAYYLYILLYVLFFMLDDLAIFLAAAFAVDRFAGEKYAGFCKLAGGLLMIGLGGLLAFYPEVLR
ncbi:glutaredoxin family protein [Roseibium aggregatum]|uniref:Glutaredoxin family protein n=1 Tax=Roseibium aggregatum TaxID=187304 RepID=A0A926S4G4_9HYPH|nr:glutaredoxin family protein [Roseibium aggregatum]MBD1545065.1 glutaredoxin family protein [Roseibium aggregatum]